MHPFAQTTLHVLISTSLLLIAIRYARRLFSDDGIPFLPLYLAAAYADALWLGSPVRDLRDNALVSLWMPALYLAALALMSWAERRGERKTKSERVGRTRSLTAADTPSTPTDRGP